MTEPDRESTYLKRQFSLDISSPIYLFLYNLVMTGLNLVPAKISTDRPSHDSSVET